MSPSPCAPPPPPEKKTCVTSIHSQICLNHWAFSFNNKGQYLYLSRAAQILTKVRTVLTLKAYGEWRYNLTHF
jgi:hypothetical protein